MNIPFWQCRKDNKLGPATTPLILVIILLPISLATSLVLKSASPTAKDVRARWAGEGNCRVLVEVPPRPLSDRNADRMPASLKIDLGGILRRFKIPGAPDLGRIQVIRFDPETGEPFPCDEFRGGGPHDIPYRFDDFDRRAHSFWYNIEGNGSSGDLVWPHKQENGHAAYYAVYFGPATHRDGPGESPVPVIGDGDALWTDRSDGYFITALHSKPALCDWNGDGRLDLLVGEIQGHVFFFENIGTAKNPKFARGRFLWADGEPVRLLHYTTPCAADWDDDGDLDLLVGRSMGGRIVWYENSGGRTKPDLKFRGDVVADGKPISLPHEIKPGESFLSQEYMAKPEAADWDGDGDKDLLAGGYVSGAIFLFENIRNSRGVPVLEARGPIMAGGEVLRAGSAASPCAADFDGDGDLDLITAKGDVITGKEDPVGMAYFENIGTRRSPYLLERAFPLRQGPGVGPVAVADEGNWDGDRDIDLVIGTMGYVEFYKNAGTRTSPKFESAGFLKNRWGPLRTGGFATAPVDWNGDGRLDLVFSRGGRFELLLADDPRNPPRYTNAGTLKAGGKEIRYVFPIGDPETFPAIADLNRDGRPDLIQGTASGDVWYYVNAGTMTEPRLEEGIRLRLKDGGFVKVGYYKEGDKPLDFRTHSGDRSDPGAADFDGDGDLDLMVSDAYGFVTYFENVGGNSGPLFAAGIHVLHESDERALIDVTDWDRDGRVDILLAQGKIRLFRNVGRGKKPEFLFDREIPHPYIPYPHPYVVDFNRDGDDDLLISSSYGVCYFLERSFADGGSAEARVVAIQEK